jgi:hypothetical protein
VAETSSTQPKSQMDSRFNLFLLFEWLLIGALFWGFYQFHNDTMWSITVWPLYLVLFVTIVIRLLIYLRNKRRGQGKWLDGIRVLVLIVVLVIGIVFFRPLTLAREIIQYSRYQQDFDVIATLSDGFCGLPETHYAVDLMPHITEQHGWKRAQVATDADGGHFIILFNRPSPTASSAIQGTAFVYAQQPQELNQRIDTQITSLYCQHNLGDGWLVCLPSS